MGVLKVNVGDAVTPDWRNIGCGTGGTPAGLFAYTEWTWTASPTQVNSQTITWRIDTFGGLPANNLSIEYMKTGGVLPGDLISTGAAPVTGGAGPPAFYTYSKTLTLGAGETLGEFRAYRIEGGVTTLVLSWNAGVAPEPGRLKLWDGTQWLKECCDGDSGRPLKVWDGTTWQTVCCMTPV